jgi:serine/threonine-protein kinase RsbW/stage II sporulation protein AB (anti-sigma F factor)
MTERRLQRDAPPSDRLRRRWPASSGSLASLRREVSAFAGRCGVRDEPAVALAVCEAATNAIVHAYVETEPGEIVVDAYCEVDHLCVVIADEGAGMKPRPDSPGLGLGLPLIAQLTDRFEVNSGAHGTRVLLRFARVA